MLIAFTGIWNPLSPASGYVGERDLQTSLCVRCPVNCLFHFASWCVQQRLLNRKHGGRAAAAPDLRFVFAETDATASTDAAVQSQTLDAAATSAREPGRCRLLINTWLGKCVFAKQEDEPSGGSAAPA